MTDAIELLDGCHPIAELRSVCDPVWVTWLLSVLDSSGLLADGPDHSPLPNVRVHGTGSLATQISALLALPTEQNDRPPDPATVHILAMPTIDADRVLVADLMRQGSPHVLVRVWERCAVVGPFVVPGVTSCVTCEDLTRRSLDPTWPVQVFQLTRVKIDADPRLVAWASATVTGHVLAFARGFTPESMSTTIEMSALDGRVTYRSWPRCPACTCQSSRP